MATSHRLEQFTIEETEEGYLITLAAEGGGSVSAEASPEQLDAIIDALDELLSEDEEAAFEVEDEED